MAGAKRSTVTCEGCDAVVPIESATKIIVEEAGRQVWTILCEACSVVHCSSCNQGLSVADLLNDRESRWTSRQLIKCNRCHEQVPANDAVELRRKGNREYRKRLCGQCFQETPAPPGFTVIRNFHRGAE